MAQYSNRSNPGSIIWAPTQTVHDPNPPITIDHAAAPSVTQPYPRRTAMLAGVLAVWSFVTAVPLFAAVGLQTQIDNPPIRGPEDRRQAVVRTWTPETWLAQRAPFAPNTSAPAQAVQVPYTRADIEGRWTELTWESQTSRKAPIPDVHDRAAVTQVTGNLILSWPQAAWDSQTTRKTVIPDRHDSAPFVRQSFADRWPEPTWDSQWTRKAPIPDASVAPDAPPLAHRLGAIWTQWDTLTTQPLWQTSGYQDGAVANPPFRSVDAQALWEWPQSAWDSQTTRKAPIPDVHESAPPLRSSSAPIALWPPLEWASQSAKHTPIPAESLASVPFSRASSVPGTLWPLVEWSTQATRKLVQGVPPVTNPTPRSPFLSHIYPQWEFTWGTQTTRKTAIPDVHDAPTPRTLAVQTTIALWSALDWPAQQTRHAPIPDAVAPVVASIYIPTYRPRRR